MPRKTIMNSAKGDSRSVILAAMVGNGGIAIAKFVAAALSGSVTMLAEAVHSVADTANQALLLVGLSLAKRTGSNVSPAGAHKEGYFWAFIASLMLFFVGGMFAVYTGTQKLLHPPLEQGPAGVSMIVLAVAIALDGGSFVVAIREFNKERGNRKLSQALFHSEDPTIPVLLLEDTGAMVGLVIALITVVLTWLTGNPVIDAVGAIVIGILLCGIGVVLAHDTRSLLVGDGVSSETQSEIEAIVHATPGVERVTQFLSMHLGPNAAVLALKVRFRTDLTLSDVEQTIGELEARIREKMPNMQRIFVEPE